MKREFEVVAQGVIVDELPESLIDKYLAFVKSSKNSIFGVKSELNQLNNGGE